MNIYVGNLPYNCNEDQLRSLFEEYGNVTSVSVIADKFTGKSRGFGFVEMADSGSAREAIEALNGSDFGGRTLVASEARPREERPRGGFGGGRNGGDRDGGYRDGGFRGKPRY